MMTIHRSLARALAPILLAAPLVLVAPADSASAITQSERVMAHAKYQQGKPYRYGANGPASFDCSGYVQYVYKMIGKKIGRTSSDQLRYRAIPKKSPNKGDILIFMKNGRAYHSAIYAGNHKMWEAQRSGTRVGLHEIWSNDFVVRRP